MSMWSSLRGLAGQGARGPAQEDKARHAAPNLPSPLDDSKVGALRRKLQETVTEREELDSRIKTLRTELRFCETSREALVQMEVWMAREVAEYDEASKPLEPQLTSLDDFCGADQGATSAPSTPASTRAPLLRALRTPRSAGRSPRARTPRAASPKRVRGDLERPMARWEPSAGSAVPAPAVCAAQEWEESIGKDTATCCHCGLRFPLDAEMIEMHSKQCSQRKGNRSSIATFEESYTAKAQQGSMRRSHSWSLPESSARRWTLLDGLPLPPLPWGSELGNRSRAMTGQ